LVNGFRKKKYNPLSCSNLRDLSPGLKKKIRAWPFE
jgi:hypothetical protein